MAVLFPIRKACPVCSKPMVAVPDKINERRSRYVLPLAMATRCEPRRPASGQTVAATPDEVVVGRWRGMRAGATLFRTSGGRLLHSEPGGSA